MLSFIEKNRCTGCTACLSICPANCISMERDREGFLYPVASDKCIDCGMCERVCPAVRRETGTKTKGIAYAAVSKDKRIWKRSASGGAFSEICRAWGDEDTLFAGAAWDGLYVRHICVKGFNNIAPLCKSKYVAGDMGDTFTQIKEHLTHGGKAVFCGTPCQVAGLRLILGKTYDNLLLIDLICHGVGSPDVFKSCMKAIGDQFGGEVKAYEFRAKRSAYETDYLAKVEFADGQEKYLVKDQYIQLFLNQNCLRPSCGENCIYRNENRPGDITIADFKGLTDVFPELAGTKRNYSSVIFNNEQGLKVYSSLEKNMRLLECSIDDIKKYNPLFCKQTRSSNERDDFFKEYISSEAAVDRWTTKATTFKTGWKRNVYNILPARARAAVSKAFSKVEK